MHNVERSLGLVLLIALAGCEGTVSSADAGDAVDAATGSDAAVGSDADITVDAGPPADTWDNFANDFVQRYCVECHAASPRDFNLLADVRANAATVRCGVSDVMLDGCGSWPPPRQFPIGTGPHPSDEERARFVRWLDAGAP